MFLQTDRLVIDAGDIASVFKRALDRHEMENGVKGQRAGCISYSNSHALACIFLFLALHMVMVSYIIPFSLLILTMGGTNCAMPGRPQGLFLCVWVRSPLKTSRCAALARDGNTSPCNFRNSLGKATVVQVLPQNPGAEYIQCVSVAVQYNAFPKDTL